MKKLITAISGLFLVVAMSMSFSTSAYAWGGQRADSSTGAQKINGVQIELNSAGMTSEQVNIIKRYKDDNKFGAIKHLYIISNFTGQQIFYDTVDGKVTSSGKRLDPKTVASLAAQPANTSQYGMLTKIGSNQHYTSEVLDATGTYGSSIEYLFYYDTTGNLKQIYPPQGATLIISAVPLSFPKLTLQVKQN